jgi:hypothetical protein
MTITRWLDPGKAIDAPKLHAELSAASIPVEGIGANAAEHPGEIRIDFTDAATLVQRTTETDVVITAHSAVAGPLKAWGQIHAGRAILLSKAAKLLDDGINGHVLALANDTTRTTALRACIGASVALLRTDAVTDTHLDKLVDLMGFPAPASATLAQCRNMLVALQAFIAVHGAMAGIAMNANE